VATATADCGSAIRQTVVVSFNARLRRLVGVAGARGATAASSLRIAGQIEVYGSARRPAPFEEPPAEPVELARPLPWELQDSDGAIADWVNAHRG
jgi:hypothetical protein